MSSEGTQVDVSNKFELFDILDVDLGGELSPHELLTGLMSLRGDVSKGLPKPFRTYFL